MVIIAVGAKGIRDNELYVAVTRAINRLDIIAPEELLQRLLPPV
jgi:ATP-dependent exoDNAse (exonuclease V) alpha subunit